MSARDADLLIAICDSSRALEAEDLDLIRFVAKRAGLAILNTRDLPSIPTAADLRERGLELPILPFSAIDLEQAPTLREELTKIIDAMMHDASPSQIAISRERHRDALASALTALRNAHASALAPMPPEIVAVD